jgi:hypothetical protein
VTPFSAPAEPARPSEPPDRPMGRVYAAVIAVEVVTLLALWWFQTTFGAR